MREKESISVRASEREVKKVNKKKNRDVRCGTFTFFEYSIKKERKRKARYREETKQNKTSEIRKQRTNEAFSSSWTACVRERKRMRHLR